VRQRYDTIRWAPFDNQWEHAGDFVAKLDEQISTLQERLTQLKLRQQRIEVRKHAVDSLRERKAETRRRILVGALVLEKARTGEMDPILLRGWLDQALMRAADRALFELAPIGATAAVPNNV
jgi:large subunit ribosomal protein L7/L12